MALSGFILKKGQVVVTRMQYSASGANVQNQDLSFGYVEKVNDLCDMYKVGDYVMFDPTGALNFVYSTGNIISGVEIFAQYSLTSEDKLLLIEPYVAPP